MKLSLITATFNSVETITDTILSVRDQHIDNLEYIIIDGGSTDGTVEILKNNADIVSCWISEPDNGIYDALNKGVQMATGNIVGFLHSDDFFADNQVLNDIVTLFNSQPVDFLYGDLEYVTHNAPYKILRYWKSGDFSSRKLKNGWMPPHPTVYFKRELFHKTGGFDTGYSIAADYDWMVRCLEQPNLKITYLPKVIVRMKTGGASNKNLGNIIRKSMEDYKIIRRNKIGGFGTLFCKNFGKLGQFFKR